MYSSSLMWSFHVCPVVQYSTPLKCVLGDVPEVERPTKRGSDRENLIWWRKRRVKETNRTVSHCWLYGHDETSYCYTLCLSNPSFFFFFFWSERTTTGVHFLSAGGSYFCYKRARSTKGRRLTQYCYGLIEGPKSFLYSLFRVRSYMFSLHRVTSLSVHLPVPIGSNFSKHCKMYERPYWGD